MTSEKEPVSSANVEEKKEECCFCEKVHDMVVCEMCESEICGEYEMIVCSNIKCNKNVCLADIYMCSVACYTCCQTFCDECIHRIDDSYIDQLDLEIYKDQSLCEECLSDATQQVEKQDE